MQSTPRAADPSVAASAGDLQSHTCTSLHTLDNWLGMCSPQSLLFACLAAAAAVQHGRLRFWLFLTDSCTNLIKVSAQNWCDRERRSEQGHISVQVIPRGSNALVTNIKQNTKIPVMGHADGICHIYIDQDADLDLACKIVADAKTDYPAACNAVEKVLVHRSLLGQVYKIQVRIPFWR